MADPRPGPSGVIELQCGRCYQTVSFDNPTPGAPLFCPICKEPMTAAPPSETALEAALWWVTSDPLPPSAPPPVESAALLARTSAEVPTVADLEVSQSGTASKPPPPLRPAPALGSGLAVAALVLGVIAFAILWLPVLRIAGLVLGSLGVVLAGLVLGQTLAQRQGGAGFVLAAALVNLQALVLAVYFLLAPPAATAPKERGTPAGQPSSAPARTE
jgi:hypothetical protein